MKKTAYILLAALGMASCDYLDIEPVGQVIPHKTSEFRALLVDGYRAFPRTNTRADLCLLGDELVFHPEQVYGNDGIPLGYNYTWQYGTRMYEYSYQSYYNSIFYANAVIANVQDADEDSATETKAQLLAEAHALRAYCHFDLTNLYGAPYDQATAATDRTAPLATHIDIEQKYYPSTVAAVYKQILDDIAEAEKRMEVEKQATDYNYRFSKNALQAFKARVLLYMGDWQGALDAAESLLGKYELADLNALGENDPRPWDTASPEIILGLDRPFNGVSGGDVITIAGEIAPGILSLLDETRDNRRAYLKEAVKTDPVFGDKTPLGYLVADRTSNTRNSIRIAEMYLIAAEAGAHLPADLSDAKTYLLTLQSKRLKPEAMDAQRAKVEAMDAGALLQEIADERARELLMEGHRWFDLRRTTRPAMTKTYEGQTYELREGDSRYTLPFPQSAIDANPDLNG